MLTTRRLRQALVTITTATHLGHGLSPVDAALVVTAQVASAGGPALTADAVAMLTRVERECQAFISLALVTADPDAA